MKVTVQACLVFRPPFCALAVEVGLEKRRYLLFSSASEEKGLVSATFFTERERPAGTAMYEKAFLLPQTGTVMMQLQVLRLFFWTAFQRCGMITIAENAGVFWTCF